MILRHQIQTALILSLPLLVGAQPRSPQSFPRTQLEKVRSIPVNAAVEVEGLIRLDVTVSDQSGNAVNGLDRNDFKVFDNDRRQNIVAFRPSNGEAINSDDSLTVIILIDTLELPPFLAEFERQQTVEFLKRNAGHLAEPVAIYSLEDSGFYLTARPSTDADALARDIASDTKVDALFLAPRMHSPFDKADVDPMFSRLPTLTGLRALATIATAEDSQPGRKLLLWIGPGLSVSGVGTGAYFPPKGIVMISRSSSGKLRPETDLDLFERICWISTLLRQARVTIDCFSVGQETLGVSDSGSNAPGPDDWKQFLVSVQSAQQARWMSLYKKLLAVQSGGRVLPPSKDLARQVAECLKDAGTYYTLTFDPPLATHADEYHSLKVELTEPGLVARTSTGYYDQPFYNDPPDSEMRHVTVAQLQQILQPVHGKLSAEHQLSTLALTERLSHAKLESLLLELREKKLREPLEMIADESAFLEPPPSEILTDPPPDSSQQQQILAAAADYLSRVIPKLPDFFATRRAIYYHELDANPELDPIVVRVPMHAVQRLESTVLYRHDGEVVEPASGPHAPAEVPSFHTYGTFGPILSTIRAVLKLGSVTWIRWEKGATGRLAVFRFAFLGKPTVTLAGCCLPDNTEKAQSGISANVHGEIIVDPSTGALLRVQLEHDLQGFVPAKRSDIMVSYGPVQIGGNTYILPMRSVSISRGRTVARLPEWNVGFTAWEQHETNMNVFNFDTYHMFRGEGHVLPDYTQAP
jgi:VWFA-related protein